MKVKIALLIFIFGIASLALIMYFYGFESDSIDNTIFFILPFGIGFIFSVIIGNVMEKLTGNFFKKHCLSFPLGKFRVNIPLFFIVVILLKIVFLKIILNRLDFF